MKDIKKILGTTLSASLATGIVGSVGTIAGAATIDEIYKAAYDATINALANKDQDSINAARTAIDKLPSEFQAFKGEFSKQVDSVQHPILVKIVNAINNADNTGKQTDINAARMTMPAGLPAVWKNSYSSGLDVVQQKLITKAVTAADAAIKSGSKTDVDNARLLLNEIATVENNDGVKSWISTYATDFINNLGLAVDTVDVLSNDTLKVNFIKEVDAATVTNTAFSAYLSDTKASVGVASVKVSEDKKSVEVKLSSAVTESKGYTLEVSGIKDLNGKTMAKDTATFEYAKAETASATLTKTKVAKNEDLRKSVIVKDSLGRDVTSTSTITFESSNTADITANGIAKGGSIAGAVKSVDVVVTPVVKDASGNVLLRGDKVVVTISDASPTEYQGYTVYTGTTLPGDVYSKASPTVDVKNGTTDAYLAFFFKDANGNELQAFSPTVASPVVVDNKTPNIAMLNATTGALTINGEGTAYFKVTVQGVEKTISVNVIAKPKPIAMNIDKTNITLAKSGVTQDVVLELKDQYGDLFTKDAESSIRYQVKNAAGNFVALTDPDVASPYATLTTKPVGTTDGKATVVVTPSANTGSNTYRVIYEHKVDGNVVETYTKDFTVNVVEKGSATTYDVGTVTALDLYNDPTKIGDETSGTFSVYNLDANGVRVGQVTGLDAAGGGYDAGKVNVTITDKTGTDVTASKFAVTETAGVYKVAAVVGTPDNRSTAPDVGDYTVTVRVGDAVVKTYTLTVTDSVVKTNAVTFKLLSKAIDADAAKIADITSMVNLTDQFGKGISLGTGDKVEILKADGSGVIDAAYITANKINDTATSYDLIVTKVKITFADNANRADTGATGSFTLPTPVVITVMK